MQDMSDAQTQSDSLLAMNGCKQVRHDNIMSAVQCGDDELLVRDEKICVLTDTIGHGTDSPRQPIEFSPSSVAMLPTTVSDVAAFTNRRVDGELETSLIIAIDPAVGSSLQKVPTVPSNVEPALPNAELDVSSIVEKTTAGHMESITNGEYCDNNTLSAELQLCLLCSADGEGVTSPNSPAFSNTVSSETVDLSTDGSDPGASDVLSATKYGTTDTAAVSSCCESLTLATNNVHGATASNSICALSVISPESSCNATDTICSSVMGIHTSADVVSSCASKAGVQLPDNCPDCSVTSMVDGEFAQNPVLPYQPAVSGIASAAATSLTACTNVTTIQGEELQFAPDLGYVCTPTSSVVSVDQSGQRAINEEGLRYATLFEQLSQTGNSDNKIPDDSHLSIESLRGVTSEPHLRRSNRHSVSSISSETRSCVSQTGHHSDDMPTLLMVADRGVSMGQGIEKLLDRTAMSSSSGAGGPGPRSRSVFDTGPCVVRSSWSQENYFDHNDLTCVDIDLDDDDDIASSVDVLHYHDSVTVASNVSLSGQLPSHSWTEDDIDKTELNTGLHAAAAAGKLRSWAPLDYNVLTTLETDTKDIVGGGDMLMSCSGPNNSRGANGQMFDYRSKSAQLVAGIAVAMESDDLSKSFDEGKIQLQALHNTESSKVPTGQGDNGTQPDLTCIPVIEQFPVATRPTGKDVDRPSAARLAKRLFYLHGFRKADVLRHLTKRNSFSQLVGEEFLKFFDFTGEAIEEALRRFVRHLTMASEVQDRDQLLRHFAHRYIECNDNVFTSEDCCHTLACAIMLLNTDLHGQNVTGGRAMNLLEFINNLAEMNDGEDFPEDILTNIYESIQAAQLEFERDDSIDGPNVTNAISATSVAPQGSSGFHSSPTAGYTNPLPDIRLDCGDVAKEYKKGYIMRKCCVEPDGRKTPLGKRGWKMFYMTLRDMTLLLYNDEQSYKRATHCSNIIRIHHALATKAGDYIKKKHVFRLQTADLAQYLIQTSNSQECQEWIDTVNFIAASYSAPYQFRPVNVASSPQKRFQRPLLPTSCTTLSLREQITHQELMVSQFERELLEHRKDPPEKGARSRIIHEYCKKEMFLKYELKRYKTYVRLLQYKLQAFNELEPSLAETAIGEVDEMSISPSYDVSVSGDLQLHVNLSGADNTNMSDSLLDTVQEV